MWPLKAIMNAGPCVRLYSLDGPFTKYPDTTPPLVTLVTITINCRSEYCQPVSLTHTPTKRRIASGTSSAREVMWNAGSGNSFSAASFARWRASATETRSRGGEDIHLATGIDASASATTRIAAAHLGGAPAYQRRGNAYVAGTSCGNVADDATSSGSPLPAL